MLEIGNRCFRWRASLFLVLAFVLALTPMPLSVRAEAPPLRWDIFTDDFESGDLDIWRTVAAAHLQVVAAAGHGGSKALAVSVDPDESYVYQTDLARAAEAYLTFWFNPNRVAIPDEGTSWIPGKSIRIADIKGPAHWHPLVALRVHRPAGQSYKAYLEWRAPDGSHYDYGAGEFDLSEGWQKITIGYRRDDWVAAWVNDIQVRQVSGVSHNEAYGSIVEIGKASTTTNITATGTLLFDDVAFQLPRVDDLWVDGEHGSDDNDGLSAATAFCTIQAAANLAGPGTTVHILPAIYRETVRPALSGSTAEPVRYVAENGPGTVIIRGSEPASALTWTRLVSDTIGLPAGVAATNLYVADLSSWGLTAPPRFIVQLDAQGEVSARLPLAREPDWQVLTPWKYHEFWWAADGGSRAATCDPATDLDPNCDLPDRSTTQLTDRSDDPAPAGIEAGNLTTLGDLTGGTLIAIDTYQGHYAYRRTIVAHDVAAGTITVDRTCEHDSGSGKPGLGWGSKYYVENLPRLLDTPGEWWYDVNTGRLYLWPPTAADPATLPLEISRRDNGFQLKNRSYITLDGLTMEFLDGSAIYGSNNDGEKSYGNTVRHATLRYANRGITLQQGVGDNAANVTRGFTLEDSEIAYMDTHALYFNYWWPDNSAAASFTHAGIVDTTIRGNELHHLGFRSDNDNAVGAAILYADSLRFEENHVHHVAHNGIQFSKSVIQSDKEYGFAGDEIKTGDILVRDNLFEQACQLTTDCGALKFWGDPPDNHVFRAVLITGNTFRDTFGWTWVSEKRGRWSGGSGSQVQGMGGFGLYVDMASGLHVYRNIAYNNASAGFMLAGVWRDGEIVYDNNIAANSLYGFHLSGVSYDTHGCVDTRLVNNILVNNEGYGILQSDGDGSYDHITIDYNLYDHNGWGNGLYKPGVMAIYRGSEPNEYYQTLAAVQAHTAWEAHGVSGYAAFVAYDEADHDLFDGSRPDLHPTAGSITTIDRGSDTLPASLLALLSSYDIEDPHGHAYDIGRYEWPGCTLTADVVPDGRVDAQDVLAVAGDWRHASFDAGHDLNHDGQIDVRDVLLVARAVGDTCARHLWLWDETVATDPAAQADFLAFARTHDIDTVYLESEWLLDHDQTSLAAFIAAADAAGVSVELLFGYAAWALTPNHAQAVALAQAAVDFSQGLSGPRPLGLHFDVEPYTLAEWDSDQNGTANQYLDLLQELAAVTQGTGLRLTVDIPFWYDERPVTRNGQTRPLSEWIIDRVDRVALMAYRDHAQSPDGIIDLVSSELVYAGSTGKEAVIGVETNCGLSPEKITFCEEGAGTMEEAFAQVRDAYRTNPAFVGVAVHDYDGYRALGP